MPILGHIPFRAIVQNTRKPAGDKGESVARNWKLYIQISFYLKNQAQDLSGSF